MNLKENNIHFSRYIPWISLEFVSTTKRMKPNHLAVQGWRKKTNLGTWSDKSWRMAEESLKSFVIVLRRLGEQNMKGFLLCFGV